MTVLEEFQVFCKKVKEYKYVCLFGIGKKAERWGYDFVREWGGREITCFSDNDPEMWGKEIVDGIKCVSPQELIEYGKELFCVISTSENYYEQISKQLNSMMIDNMLLNNAWLGTEEMIEKCLEIKIPKAWGENNKLGEYNKKIDENLRVAVYTCIIGDYDDLRQPLVQDLRCDYYILSFEKPKKLGVYQWIDISDKVPANLKDFTRVNRFCKMHPTMFFPQYEYSIYVDGSIQIQTKVAHLIKRTGKIGIASYGATYAKDSYEHASALCVKKGYGEKMGVERIKEQYQRYVKEGFPYQFGFTENGVMVREHNNKACIQVMETWWEEVLNNSRRDQLSFMYSVWKNGFIPQDIGYIDDTFRNGPEFKCYPKHNKEYDGMARFNR